MVKSFAHKGLELFFLRGSTTGIQAMHAKRLRLILAMLEQARTVDDMNAPGAAAACAQGRHEGAVGGHGAGQLARDISIRRRRCPCRGLPGLPLKGRQMTTMHNPPHPGELLSELWLLPQGLSITAVAALLKVSRKTLSEIVNGRASITPEMAFRLELAFGKSAESWLGHQAAFDLYKLQARRDEFGIERVAAAT